VRKTALKSPPGRSPGCCIGTPPLHGRKNKATAKSSDKKRAAESPRPPRDRSPPRPYASGGQAVNRSRSRVLAILD
jgi:hypothetical protein